MHSKLAAEAALNISNVGHDGIPAAAMTAYVATEFERDKRGKWRASVGLGLIERIQKLGKRGIVLDTSRSSHRQ